MHFIKGDVRNVSDWKKALEGQDVVFHFAAETGTGQSMYEINKYYDVNILGTSVFLDLITSEKYELEKVVFSSSRAIYGEGKYFCPEHGNFYPTERNDQDLRENKFDISCPVCSRKAILKPTDEQSLIHPVSHYAITKYTQEIMIMNSCKALGIPATSLRYQNVFGPGQSLSNPYTGILAIFSTRFIENRDVFIFEDGMESRDFVFIDDVVKANILAMENEIANGKVYNVGTGINISVLEVAEKLKEIYSSESVITITGESRKGDIRHNFADLAKINRELNFIPKYSFDEGLKLFAEWVQKQETQVDQYEKSLSELKKKGLLK